MIILGLHFGHDAGAAVIKDGEIVSCVIRERQTRVKHAMTLDVKTIFKAMADAGVKPGQIDYCAVTSTQGVELIVDDPKKVSIVLMNACSRDNEKCSMLKYTPMLNKQVLPTLTRELTGHEHNGSSKGVYASYYPEYENSNLKDLKSIGWLDNYVFDEMWFPPRTLNELYGQNLGSEFKGEYLKFGFHFPAKISLDGCVCPAYLVNHHICHASSVYYKSGFEKSAILTHDGGNGLNYDSGMFFHAEKNAIYPIAPHHAVLGFIYDQVALFLNLGISSAGKLMGLAAYGQPVFYDKKYLGNWNDLVNLAGTEDPFAVADHWIFHCLSLAKDKGYDLSALGDPQKITDPINVDIAASTQKLFEENMLALVDILYKYLFKNNIRIENLCLSGGAALNCPANSRVRMESSFNSVFIDPGCDDSGLAIGAALYCYHHLLDMPPLKNNRANTSPFQGPRIAEDDILLALESFGDQLSFKKNEAWAVDAARELENNSVVGWFCGRSEVGPRALGHRSILADARDLKNWERVNRIKGREWWRPFAPAVLESEMESWFSDAPNPSPYMLFNASVKSKEVPAITHADGSARIQTVNENDGPYYDLLKEFFKNTGVPVILNTSFNGPSEPIVETPLDALRFFADSELDVLYMDSFKVTHKHKDRGKNIASKQSFSRRKAGGKDAKKFMMDFKEAEYARTVSALKSPPLPVESYKGYNIVWFDAKFCAFFKGLGKNLDLLRMDKAFLQGLSDRHEFFADDKLSAVEGLIDRLGLDHPLVIEEGYNGFNILYFKKRYHAVSQSLGELELGKAEESCLNEYRASNEFFVGDNLLDVKGWIDQYGQGGPEVIESGYEGFNILRFRRKYYAVSNALDGLDLAKIEESRLSEYRASNEFFVGEDLQDVKRWVNQYGRGVTEVIESGYKGFNILRFRRKYYAVSQSFGELDLGKAEESCLDEYRASNEFFVGDNLPDVKGWIDQYGQGGPEVIESGYEGFNILRFRRKYYAVSQSLGEIDWGNTNFDRYCKDLYCAIGESMEEVKSTIQSYLDAIPVLIEIYGGYNIILHKGKYYAIAKLLGEIDWGNTNFDRYCKDLYCPYGDSVEKLKAIISKRDKLFPRLVGVYRNYNILYFRNCYFGVRHGVADIDWLNLVSAPCSLPVSSHGKEKVDWQIIEESLNRQFDLADVVKRSSFEEVKISIDLFELSQGMLRIQEKIDPPARSEPLNMESYRGFNIIWMGKKCYGVRHGLIGVDFDQGDEVLTAQYSPEDFVVRKSVDGVKDGIDFVVGIDHVAKKIKALQAEFEANGIRRIARWFKRAMLKGADADNKKEQ